MGEGSRNLGRNQRGLRVGCCAMVGDYYDDSSVKENLNLLLCSARIETNIDSKYQGVREILEGCLQGTRMLGASSATLSNSRLCKRFKDLYKERTLESSARTLRNPEVKGELSRFKLEKSTGDIVTLYKCRPGAQTKQCS